MASTLTIRDISEQDNKMLEQLQKLTGEKVNTKALLRAGYMVKELTEENRKLQKKVEALENDKERVITAVKVYNKALKEINKIA